MERKPRFFDYDGAFMRFLQNVVDLIFLNLLFVVGCLPVLTIGGSLLALYEVSMSHCRYGRGRAVVREFWRSYKRHLRTGLLLSPILLVVIAALILDFMWLGSMPGSIFAGALLAMMAILTLLFGMIFTYFFPMMGEGDMSLWEGAQKAFYHSLIHWPRALLLSAVRITFVAICLHIPIVFLSTMPVFLMIGCSLLALIYCLFLEPTLPEE